MFLICKTIFHNLKHNAALSKQYLKEKEAKYEGMYFVGVKPHCFHI